MALFKSLKKNGKKNYGSKVGKKEVKFVWLASSEAIFLIKGEVRESKYSYGVQIVPLYGKYRSSKERKVYDAEDLKGHNVILNLPKDANVDELKGKKLVVLGYSEDEVLIDKNEKDEEGEKE